MLFPLRAHLRLQPQQSRLLGIHPQPSPDRLQRFGQLIIRPQLVALPHCRLYRLLLFPRGLRGTGPLEQLHQTALPRPRLQSFVQNRERSPEILLFRQAPRLAGRLLDGLPPLLRLRQQHLELARFRILLVSLFENLHRWLGPTAVQKPPPLLRASFRRFCPLLGLQLVQELLLQPHQSRLMLVLHETSPDHLQRLG